VKRALGLLGVGFALVGVAWLVSLFVHGGWVLFAFITGGLAVFFLMLVRGELVSGDKRRPPGAARVSGARSRAEAASQAFGYLLAAAPLAVAAVLCIVLYA